MPRGVTILHKLRDRTEFVDVVVAGDRVQYAAAVVEPVLVTRCSSGGGMDDDAADRLHASLVVRLTRHAAPGDWWWRGGVHVPSVPQLIIDRMILSSTTLRGTQTHCVCHAIPILTLLSFILFISYVRFQ